MQRPTTTGSARNREPSSTALMVGRRHCSWCSAFRSGWNRKTDKPTAPTGDTAKYAEALLGKWVSRLNTASGYEFVDYSTVRISLAGISTDGTYTLSLNENGRCEVKINYVSLAGMTVSNTYIAEIGKTELTLIQKNAESVSVTYVKAQ